MSRIGRYLVSSDDTTTPAVATSTSILSTAQGGTGLDTSGDTGIPWLVAGSWDVPPDAINVRHSAYGAVGDGTTDDSVAIQLAFDAATAGSTVYFPPGTYVLESAGVCVDVNGVDDLKVVGNNAILYTPVTATTTTRPMVIRNSDGLEVSGIYFLCEVPQTRTLDGGLLKLDYPCNGLDLQNVENNHVHHCKFKGQTYYGMSTSQDTIADPDVNASCANTRVSYCEFEDIATIGLELFPKVNDGWCKVTNCKFKNCGNAGNDSAGYGAKLGQGYDEVLFSENILENCGDDVAAVNVTQYGNVTLRDNLFLLCPDLNISIGVANHTSLGAAAEFKALVIQGNTFICDPAATDTEPLIFLENTTAVGVTAYDANVGTITIVENTFTNTPATRTCIQIRPSNAQVLKRVSVIGNKGINLGRGFFGSNNDNTGYLDNPTIAGNYIKCSDSQEITPIICTDTVAGSFVGNTIENAYEYGMSLGIHTEDLYIVGNTFIKGNRNGTASRAPILLNLGSTEDVYLYNNVAVPYTPGGGATYAAMVLGLAAYTIYHAGNIAPRVATNATPTLDGDIVLGTYGANADANITGIVTMMDVTGNARKFAIIN